MGTYLGLFCAYVLGGLTFLPLLVGLILYHAYLTFPTVAQSSEPLRDRADSLLDAKDDGKNIKSAETLAGLGEKFRRGHEPDVAAGYFAVCREYVPGGVNGKPPERTTPAGAVVAAESPSVYQSMYRSIFDRKQGPSLDAGKGNVKPTKRARNVFFVVLRHGHLMLYDDVEQVEVRHVISLEHHHVSIFGGDEEIPEGELWIKRNAICLSRKPSVDAILSNSKPFYFFSENCSEKEDFYFALLQNQEVKPGDAGSPPRPQYFDTKDIILLVQQLHSSEEQLQTRWINALVGRLFLAMYKTPEVEAFIRNKITKKIARVKKPAFISGIILRKIVMGESAPYITNPRLRDLTVDGDCCVEADIKYSGNFRIEIATTARIDLGARFKVREVNLVLAAVVKRLEGHLLVKFKPPPSNRIWISFENMPDMELSIEPIVSSRQITYGVILRQIESRIREVIAETIVLPHWDDSPFFDTSHQAFRAGVWKQDPDVSKAASQHTEVPDEVVQDEADVLEQTALPPSSHRVNDERTMSMPSLSDPAVPAAPTQKTATSNEDSISHSNVDVANSGVAASAQKPSAPPKAIRSRSFASVADPLVSMDHANISSAKSDPMRTQHTDATSTMKAISHRSPPTSPVDISIPLISDITSSASWKSKGKSEQDDQRSMSSSPVPVSPPPTPTSTKSYKSLNHNHGDHAIENHADRQSPSIQAKKQSVGVISAATAAAAKSWGWNVLSRAKEQKHLYHSDGAGTPESPLGRGRPLPPLGQPLPPPENPSTKVAHNGSGKRKPVPSSLPPSRRPSETSVRSEKAPPLPSRRRQPSTAKEHDDRDSLLIVGMPPESQPASPSVDDRKDFLLPPLEANMKECRRDFPKDPSPADPLGGKRSVEHNEAPTTPATDNESKEVQSTSKPVQEDSTRHDEA
ncbi:hypothetical protein XPA_002106 [Xanthoria parietina]